MTVAASPVGFGGVWFIRILRDTDIGSLPDWAPHKRIARFGVPGGGTIVQDLGWDADTLELLIEVEDATAAAELRGLIGTEDDLILPDNVWAEGGDYAWDLDQGYRTFSDVLLADAVPEGVMLWGCHRFQVMLERVHA